MASNLSTFPEKIDTFIRHYDVGSVDLANVQRYQTLRVKDSLTSAETEEMNSLFSALREKMWLAEDLNKIQDCMTNLETFFKYQTETYIAEKFAIYDERMDNLETTASNLNTELENTIAKGNAWISNQMATLHDSTYFDFDNMSYRAGFTIVAAKTDTGFSEILKNTYDGSIFATRISTKNGDKDYTVVTTCDKVEPAVSVTEHIYKNEAGEWVTNAT